MHYIEYNLRNGVMAQTYHMEKELECRLCFRIPDWIKKKARIYINYELEMETDCTDKFLELERVWKDGDKIVLTLPIGLSFIPLPDDAQMGAFRYGPDVLAGITEEESVLALEGQEPEEELSADTEREWGTFRTFYRTEHQDPCISFRKLNEIGYEPYQIYFKVKRN